MPGGGQKVSFPNGSGVWRGKNGADWPQVGTPQHSEGWQGMSHLGNILFGQGWAAAGFAFNPEKWRGEKKKPSKVTEPWGKCDCFLLVIQQKGLWICRMSFETWGNPWARPKGQGKVQKWHMGQDFGRIQALKMDGGKQGLHFLAVTWHQTHPPVPLSLSQDLLGVIPWASGTAQKAPHGFWSQTKQPQQWWFCLLLFNRGKIPPLWGTQTYDSLLLSL